MADIVVGIDPDVKGHGTATYVNGLLWDMARKTTRDIEAYIKEFNFDDHSLLFSIENVSANTFLYGGNITDNELINRKIMLSVGRNQQAFEELKAMIESYKIPIHLYKPQKDNWAKHRHVFEKATGWKKRSNEDCRSAAFFGYLAI